ncbi:MAG: hypothetical protein AB7U44_11515 [Sulfuricurvum sp.]|uniref:hypothetical protein n=1 Tax=Sulfuricurvum sp. TaxID=2025608 RepID=UPI003D112D9D
MKTSHSLFALLLAVILHIGVVSLFWFVLHHTEKEHPIIHEKRFGVTLTEEESFSQLSEAPPKSPDQPLSDSSIPIRKHIIESKSQTGKETDSKLPEEPVSNVLPHYTQADRDILPNSVLHHYGDEFFTLSSGEQHYIIDNLQRIRKINEIVGTRLLRERPDDEIDPDDNNIVEFYLNTDGTISDLHLLKNRLGTPLDELTLQTIDLAHSRYPKPEQKTLIRIRVYIIVK